MDENENEVVAAIGELEQRALSRITAIEKKIAGLPDLDKHLADLEKSLLSRGGGREASDVLSPQKKTVLGNALRALLNGDAAKANSLFAEVIEQKDALVGSDPQGGYVTLPQFSSEMVTVAAEFSPMSRLARTVTLTQSGVFEEPIDRETAEATWVGETDTRPVTNTPKLGLLRIECHELMAQPKISQTLVDDAAIDITGWLTRKVGEAFGLAESAAFINGSGVGRPRGLLTLPLSTADDDTRPWGTLQILDSGADGGFIAPTTADNPADVLQQLVGLLKAQYRSNARFLMSRRTAALVSTIKDSFGRWVWQTSMVQGQPSTLLGFPVELDETMPNPAAGSLSIAFGDFRAGYTITRRLGQRFLPDPYTDKPWLKLYSWERVGGGVANSEAIKILRLSD
jgi:HK97 family phage major capsid protein